MPKENKNPLFENTIKIVPSIPRGKVVAYGDVANYADSPGSARYVSYILSSSSKKYKLPWHRVINAQGKISSHKASITQARLLKKEGVTIERSKISMEAFRWVPSDKDLKKILSQEI